MKIIFLDIDGVLNRIGQDPERRTKTSWKGFIGMEPSLVSRFNLLCERTRAKVVLSSTWRFDTDWLDTMKTNGLTCEFIGRTTIFRVHERKRGEEIHEWLKENHNWPSGDEFPKYVIIDDDSDFLPGQPLYKTNCEDGLTIEMAIAIEKYLNE